MGEKVGGRGWDRTVYFSGFSLSTVSLSYGFTDLELTRIEGRD